MSVDLSISPAPSTTDLYFWALQASFASGNTNHGAGHIGLQHIAGYPGSTAVNWGGYHEGGGELPGSTSTLPSARNNVNTRDYSWSAGRAYRLTIERTEPKRWLGSVTDLASGERTAIRELFCAGDELRHVVIWSEVFAPCDAPAVEARWANPTAIDNSTGTSASPTGISVSYQRVDDGGCSNSYTWVDSAESGVVRQRTNTERQNNHGDVVSFGEPA